ncbi:phosphoinositide 3-phosphate phosphatase [Beauveria bassiana ARSEF 2860]|uniref:phosphatidylinositol-3,4,5-trisphosphate 3-phosphatase n=1 Tax=Beauveria bassiana (strain ARSEF 2860) TaxID=655819 RepID=J4UIK7_BEAB2|nr:phosphoinositide 3-phosphate phosphatase [Beauveria bassiana ARSEF 2860]EJP63422.1 phosphoinositide 3-phosphate phosphatase [Beauveria bassiana ARSEF 2860]
MASFLRQLVAGPRRGHSEAGLDLCYVTDHIIATSGPSHTYPKLAYRNPLDQLVTFLDAKHGADWAIWEFRAEGTGYPDHLVYDRIRHYPFPDHHPPPFSLMPRILASMRHWLHGGALDGVGGSVTEKRHPDRVVVVHCKAGKGRSGTASVSYLVAEEGWRAEDALARFTERRMRPMFGAGVSIPSQLRWVRYVDRWTRHGKRYADRPIEILEIHTWGLRNGVKLDVEGFAEDGKRICSLHTFQKKERQVVQGGAPADGGLSDLVWEMAGYSSGTKAPAQAEFADATNNEDTATAKPANKKEEEAAAAAADLKPPTKSKTDLITEQPTQESTASASRASTFSTSSKLSSASSRKSEAEPGGMAVLFRPATPIRVPTSDVCVAVERRNRTHKSIGLTMVSSVAHVWFNAFFEGNGPEQGGSPDADGVFTIEWDAMDGIKGTSRKGSRCLDKMSVVWRFADTGVSSSGDGGGGGGGGDIVGAAEPAALDTTTAGPDDMEEKDIGLRVQSPASADISRASSVLSAELPRHHKKGPASNDADDVVALESVKTSDAAGEELRPEATRT